MFKMFYSKKKQVVRKSTFAFCSSQNNLWLLSSSSLQCGRWSEALRHQQDPLRIWLRWAVQPVQLTKRTRPSLPAHVFGPAQWLSECDASIPGLWSAETVRTWMSPLWTREKGLMGVGVTRPQTPRFLFKNRGFVLPIADFKLEEKRQWSLKHFSDFAWPWAWGESECRFLCLLVLWEHRIKWKLLNSPPAETSEAFS